MFGLAEIAIREGRYPDAEAYYRKSIAAGGGNFPMANAGLGLLLLRLGRDQEAAQEFDLALDADSSLWRAHYGKARLYLADEEWSKAKKELDRRRRTCAGWPRARKNISTGWPSTCWAPVTSPAPKNPPCWPCTSTPPTPITAPWSARIYEMNDNTVLAINAYEQALAMPGMTPTAPMLNNLGTLYRKEKRFNEARDSLTRAVAVDSTYAPALKDLGDLYRLANQHDKAARAYLRYILLERDDLEVLLDLADSCYEIRSFAQGAEAAQTARKLAPDNQDAQFQFARSGIYSRDAAVKAEAAGLMAGLAPGPALAGQRPGGARCLADCPGRITPPP